MKTFVTGNNNYCIYRAGAEYLRSIAEFTVRTNRSNFPDGLTCHAVACLSSSPFCVTRCRHLFGTVKAFIHTFMNMYRSSIWDLKKTDCRLPNYIIRMEEQMKRRDILIIIMSRMM
ncbi:MAG: hypothetical protein LBG28_10000 [Tannerella sp.]|nr:hypothetical protein [Tannerella sp.]